MKKASGGIHRMLAAALAAVALGCGGPLEQAGAPAVEQSEGLGAATWAELANKGAVARPAIEPNVTLGEALPPKEAANARAALVSPSFTWTVSLSTSDQLPWVTRCATITATTNSDVGPTPYYIRILEGTAVIASCGFGTSCSIPVIKSTPLWDTFRAVVQDSGGNTVASTANPTYVDWHVAQYDGMKVTPPSLWVGWTSTVTVHSGYDVGPSPFYTELWDETAGALLAVCPSGTSCSANVNQTVATTHQFRAFLSDYSTVYPPAGIHETSEPAFGTWAMNGWTVSLVEQDYWHYTATTNIDVGPTPYFTQIFDWTTGELLIRCGAGTTCTYFGNRGGHMLVAFIMSYSPTINLSLVQASSNTLDATTIIYLSPVLGGAQAASEPR